MKNLLAHLKKSRYCTPKKCASGQFPALHDKLTKVRVKNGKAPQQREKRKSDEMRVGSKVYTAVPTMTVHGLISPCNLPNLANLVIFLS